MTVKSESRTGAGKLAMSSTAVRQSSGSGVIGGRTTRRACKLNSKGETRLHVAARLNKVADVVTLLVEGADINARDYAGTYGHHRLAPGNLEMPPANSCPIHTYDAERQRYSVLSTQQLSRVGVVAVNWPSVTTRSFFR